MPENGTSTSGTYRWDGWEDDRHDAVFDSEREYRYSLTRTWNPEKPTLAWIMLNPSTADETEDDPTIRRCLGYAKDWGYGEIVVANLFALRATDPSELREHENPVGEENDEHLRRVCEDADRVVAAWGANGDLQNRGREVARTVDADLYALDTTKDGHPVHPLYQPADAEPEPWDERALLAATDGGEPQEPGSDRDEWDESWARIREMEPGVDDPLPEFQRTVNAMMERLGNDVGRPLVMKVTVEVHDGELADHGGESDDE